MSIDCLLSELAEFVGFPVERLVRYGAAQKLTIQTVAEDWNFEGATEDSRIDGRVTLTPEDLGNAIGHEYLKVRRVRLDDGRDVALCRPRPSKSFSALFVTAEERDRFVKYVLENSLSDHPSVPAYLDKNHRYYSVELDVAVRAWLAVYEHGVFLAENVKKKHIVKWLEANYPDSELSKSAREVVARVVNYDPKGGR